ncbi:arylamine N-acetyltransferase [Streptomyces sp. HSW2009]|uniref:arylamine N-acetyltransferase family protein n=1 Tax=Streptomyces sp. HSW2009 TaxID=3142890 RepID=UPI0032F07428
MPADHDPSALDLTAYLARIQWSGKHEATADTLRSLHRAHLLHIPFENAEGVLGSAPSLALADVQRKLVQEGRGGYCYEQNSLLATALRAMGFDVTYLAARVRTNARGEQTRPRTHMVLMVRVPGSETPHLADVGFGATGLLEAIPLEADAPRARGAWTVRLVREPQDGPDDLWVLQLRPTGGAWSDVYAFTREPFEFPDFEIANWYMATHPRSPFYGRLFAEQPGVDHHLALIGRQLIHTRGDGTAARRELSDDTEVLNTLATSFGIHLPPGTRLPA